MLLVVVFWRLLCLICNYWFRKFLLFCRLQQQIRLSFQQWKLWSFRPWKWISLMVQVLSFLSHLIQWMFPKCRCCVFLFVQIHRFYIYIYILVDDCLFVDVVRWNQASKSEHWLFLCLFIILPNFMKSAHGKVPKLRGYFVHYSRYILPRKIGCINLAAEGNLDFL